MCTKRRPGQAARVASSRFRVPTALTSKSSNGMRRRAGRGSAARPCGRSTAGLSDLHQGEHAGAVADIELVVAKPGQLAPQAAPGSSACRPAARRTRPAGCCQSRARQYPSSRPKCRHTSEPIRPEEPVTIMLRACVLMRRLPHLPPSPARGRASASPPRSRPAARSIEWSRLRTMDKARCVAIRGNQRPGGLRRLNTATHRVPTEAARCIGPLSWHKNRSIRRSTAALILGSVSPHKFKDGPDHARAILWERSRSCPPPKSTSDPICNCPKPLKTSSQLVSPQSFICCLVPMLSPTSR